VEGKWSPAKEKKKTKSPRLLHNFERRFLEDNPVEGRFEEQEGGESEEKEGGCCRRERKGLPVAGKISEEKSREFSAISGQNNSGRLGGKKSCCSSSQIVRITVQRGLGGGGGPFLLQGEGGRRKRE